MRILRPVSKDNPLTGKYTDSHKGYDHDDKPDPNYRSSIYGKITQAKNSETRNWIANSSSDPYKPSIGKRALRTEDYGNYLIISGEVDGKQVKQLGAHFEPGSVLPKGTEVKAGQIVARIGNTGNSTGSHCHTEYRDANNQNFSVEFIDKAEEPPQNNMDKRQIIIDAYLALRPNQAPSEDEINARLQKNENPKQLIESIISGDGRAREYWLDEWGVTQEDINQNKLIAGYEGTIFEMKEVLRRVNLEAGADSEKMIAKMEGVVDELLKLREQAKPIYKYEGKDYELAFKFFGLLVINEKG